LQGGSRTVTGCCLVTVRRITLVSLMKAANSHHVIAIAIAAVGGHSPSALFHLPPPVCTTQVDPLVSLMKVEKVPDSTYDMVGGLDQQIKEIKEVSG